MSTISPDTISVSENVAKSKCFLQGAVYCPYKLFRNVMVPDTLLRFKGLSPSSKLCFGQLARYAGENGACFPSVATIATSMGLSGRQVERCLTQLESQRFIQRIARRNTSNWFQFLWHPVLQGSLREAAVTKTSVADTSVTPPPDRYVANPLTDVSGKESEVSGSGISECVQAAPHHPPPPPAGIPPVPQNHEQNPPIEVAEIPAPPVETQPVQWKPVKPIPEAYMSIARALEGKALHGVPDVFICRRICVAAGGDVDMACYFIEQKFQYLREGSQRIPDRLAYFETVVREETEKQVYRRALANAGVSARKLNTCEKCSYAKERCMCHTSVLANLCRKTAMPAIQQRGTW
ncbi:MAG: helix-turn-helix domain-containing protein [Bryobacteraceae bacterium]